ncbi:cerebellar degeneration-related protein 2-like [Nerophis ophidion]|uniref:cerebellar degeneration-related protein 2-like n=1 Tax=Nerophis ophidion TaxID=159077 RepID=UPI002ADF904C|nr:cerebellar degeneration-related protein 2-like [Nerophis ophidion]
MAPSCGHKYVARSHETQVSLAVLSAIDVPAENMLTDVSVDEEFELKEEEPWYDKQDLERGRSWESNQEPSGSWHGHSPKCNISLNLLIIISCWTLKFVSLQHLSKQVEVLRQVNDQHAKVYEQLDLVARELEQSNRKLTLDQRSSQQKVHRLTETVEMLQVQVEELQVQVEEVKLGPSLLAEGGPWRTRRAQSVSCLEELQRPPEEPRGEQECCGVQRWHEEQQASLRHSLHLLQTQYAGERTRREEAEREAGLLNRENAALEQQLARMERCKVRVSELEREAEELRGLWKSRSFARCEEEEEEEMSRRPFKRWASERLLKVHDSAREHESCCARRAQVGKHGGVSLLKEVDAQYSALQVKYDQLLGRLSQQRHHDDQEEEEEVVQTLTKDDQEEEELVQTPTKDNQEEEEEVQTPTKDNQEVVQTPTKDNQEEEVQTPTKDNQEVQTPTKDNQEVQTPTKDNQEVQTPTKDNQEVQTPTKDNQEVQTPTKDNQEVQTPTKDNQEVQTPTKDNQEVQTPTKDNQEVQTPTKDNQEVQTPTKDNQEVQTPTKDNQEVQTPTKDNQEVQTPTKVDHNHQPEYKLLFREIFSRLKKTKEDLIENRMRRPAGQVASLRSRDS